MITNECSLCILQHLYEGFLLPIQVLLHFQHASYKTFNIYLRISIWQFLILQTYYSLYNCGKNKIQTILQPYIIIFYVMCICTLITPAGRIYPAGMYNVDLNIDNDMGVFYGILW